MVLQSASRQLDFNPDHPLALADGSVVVFPATDQATRIAAGATSPSPVPEWVKARASAVFANVRGGHANAFATVRSAPGAACQVDVEILTADGQSCGTTTLRTASPCDFVTFGADRTVFTTGQAGDTCTWRWWSGLLR